MDAFCFSIQNWGFYTAASNSTFRTAHIAKSAIAVSSGSMFVKKIYRYYKIM